MSYMLSMSFFGAAVLILQPRYVKLLVLDQWKLSFKVGAALLMTKVIISVFVWITL